jgi:DNA-binding CsgD family transcriptional regulator
LINFNSPKLTSELLSQRIAAVYRKIFKAYGHPTLEDHIAKLVELDEFLPYNDTFFCITNTQSLSFEYVSKNIRNCLGLDPDEVRSKGMRYFWKRIHPEDVENWLTALKDLMSFTIDEIDITQRKNVSYTWNYRFRNADDDYVTIIQNTTPVEFDVNRKPVIGLAHYTVLNPNIRIDMYACAKMLNSEKEYETVYYNNFSQKRLAAGISNRERDIIRLLVLNQSSKEIGRSLCISPNTVDTHRRNILKKLNISSTGELVAMVKMNKLNL